MVSTERVRSRIIEHEYFVVEEEETIRLLTFTWYTPEKCNEAQLVEVNSFDKSSRRWQHENFMIDKFSHFHGCQSILCSSEGCPNFNQSRWITKTGK